MVTNVTIPFKDGKITYNCRQALKGHNGLVIADRVTIKQAYYDAAKDYGITDPECFVGYLNGLFVSNRGVLAVMCSEPLPRSYYLTESTLLFSKMFTRVIGRDTKITVRITKLPAKMLKRTEKTKLTLSLN